MPTLKKKILAISGSTRHDSVNMEIINSIGEMIGNDYEFKVYNGLAELPYFNPDTNDENVHVSVKHFLDEINNADAVLICTPEYVFSIPGILKNAIEWTVSTVVFSDKPTAIITASSSGHKAHESLLIVMKTVGARIEEDSALLISGARTKINKKGEFTDDLILEKVHKLITSLTGNLA